MIVDCIVPIDINNYQNGSTMAAKQLQGMGFKLIKWVLATSTIKSCTHTWRIHCKEEDLSFLKLSGIGICLKYNNKLEGEKRILEDQLIATHKRINSINKELGIVDNA